MQLTLGQVPKYLKDRYGICVTRQTVYNWVRVGKNKEMLKHAKIHTTHARLPWRVVTTGEWVADFLQRSGLLPQPAVAGD